MPIAIQVQLATNERVLPWRARQREELNCQIVHDSIHDRDGWSRSYLLECEGSEVGFGSVAIAGPWQDKPTVFEFYLRPELRARVFDFFEAFLSASGARFFEVQSNDALLAVMLHTYGRDISSEKIVFRDGTTTALPANGAILQALTSPEEIRACLEHRAGGGQWQLEVDGAPAGKGGFLFHYNRPYSDIYMEIAEPFRRRGLGSYLVQELKALCYGFGAIPCARCSPDNTASRKTLTRAGFVPFAHILLGSVADASS